jgi:hypothetical protein
MQLDHEKLLTIIKQEVNEMKTGYWTETSVCIGELDGVQIQVKITADEDSISDCPNRALFCITP